MRWFVLLALLLGFLSPALAQRHLKENYTPGETHVTFHYLWSDRNGSEHLTSFKIHRQDLDVANREITDNLEISFSYRSDEELESE